jgi:hypothetical protein
VKSKTMVPQRLAWAAWVVFITSLFLPIEHHTLPWEVSRFCFGGAFYCGYQNAGFFVLSPVFLLLNLVQAIQTAIFYPEMLGAALSIVLTMAIYSILGLGQLLIALAPLWPVKIKRPARLKLLFWVVLLSAMSMIAYGLFPDIRMGVGLLSGYYWWALSFLLLLGACAWMLYERNLQNETTLLSLTRKIAAVGQGLAILAWIAFLVSLFLPVHMSIAQPLMHGWEFFLTFLMDMILLPLLIVSSGFDIDLLESLFFATIYNIGNLLLFVAPILPNKFHLPVLRKTHLGIVLVCTLAATAYKYLENIQLGYMHYRGYDVWVLAYVLLLMGSILMLSKNDETTGMDKG